MNTRRLVIPLAAVVLAVLGDQAHLVAWAAQPGRSAQQTPGNLVAGRQPDIQSKVLFIDARLKAEVEEIEKAATGQRQKAFLFSIASVVFAAAITVLLGWRVDDRNHETRLKRAALILGALITVANSVDAFYDHRSLWVRSTMTLARLLEVQDRFDFYRAGKPLETMKVDDLSPFVDELEQIRQEHVGAWSQVRQSQKSKEK